MALFSVWLGSRQRRTLVLPSGRTFSRTVMLLHQLVGSSTFVSFPRVTMSSSFAFTFSSVTRGDTGVKDQAEWLTHSS